MSGKVSKGSIFEEGTHASKFCVVMKPLDASRSSRAKIVGMLTNRVDSQKILKSSNYTS